MTKSSNRQTEEKDEPWLWTLVKLLLLLLTFPWGPLLWGIWDWAANVEPIGPHGSQSLDFYRTSRWKSLSRRCKDRDNWTCQKCGAGGPGIELHAHHKIPRSRGGSDSLQNLETLCARCHSREHGRPVGTLAYN